MGLPVRDQMKYWGVAGALFLVFLWFTGDVLLPFLIGAAIAYFLDPVADRLEAMGLSRAMATMVITLVALLIFVLMALLVIPTLMPLWKSFSRWKTPVRTLLNLESPFPTLSQMDR